MGPTVVIQCVATGDMVSLYVCICVLIIPPFCIRLLDWRERRTDGPKRMKNERIIVFKHLFDPKEFEVSEAYHSSCLRLHCHCN